MRACPRPDSIIAVANGIPLGEGHEGQGQKHHERALLSRHPVGVGGEESHHQRSPERKEAKNPRGLNHRRSRQSAGRHSGAVSHGGFSRWLQRIAGRRTVRAEVGGCGFRQERDSHPAVHSETEDWTTETEASRNRFLTRNWRTASGSSGDPYNGPPIGLCEPCENGRQPYWVVQSTAPTSSARQRGQAWQRIGGITATHLGRS